MKILNLCGIITKRVSKGALTFGLIFDKFRNKLNKKYG
jgi:hypothetical protein